MNTTRPAARHSSIQYRPDIDGLRAVAVLLVVVFHAFPHALPGGFIGVDVFFVISGYLITSILVQDFARDQYSLLRFYARRVRRIVPALLTVLVTVWILGWFFLLAKEYSNLGLHTVAGAAFASNVLLRFESGYFDVAAAFKPLLHLWSLGVEEQFYLIWPLLLVFALRRRFNVLLIVMVLLAASFAANIHEIDRDPATAFYFLHTRFWELALGCALACLEKLDARHLGSWVESKLAPWVRAAADGRTRGGSLKSWLGAALLAAGAVLIDGHRSFPGWWALLPTLGALLLICAGPGAWLNRRCLSLAPVVSIGLVSYPLYLWHWPLLSFAAIAEEGAAAPALRCGAVALSIGLAYLTWMFVEKPAQQRLFAQLPAGRRALGYVLSGVAALALVGVAGLLTIYRQGFPARYPAQESIAAQMNWNTNGATRCRAQYAVTGICWSTSSEPRTAVWGESHAEMMLPGMAVTPDLATSSIVVIGNYGCPPLLGVEIYYGPVNQRCARKTDELRTAIAARMQGVKNFVLISRGPVYFSGSGFGREIAAADPVPLLAPVDGAPPDAAQRTVFLEGYSRTIAFLESLGKNVIFFIDVPELGFDPVECVDIRPLRFTIKRLRRPCGIPAAEVAARQREYRALVGELAARHPRMRVFDPTPLLCDARLCNGMLDGTVIYRDDDHLSAAGSAYVAAPLMRLVESAKVGS